MILMPLSIDDPLIMIVFLYGAATGVCRMKSEAGLCWPGARFVKEDLRRLLVSETEMYSANGLGHALDAIREYKRSMSRNIDNCLKFLAIVGAVGMAGVAAVTLAIAAANTGLVSLAAVPGVMALACGLALLLTRGIDFEGRFVMHKFGKETYERYAQYLKPLPMQKRLFEEVERFNKLVRAIHVSDEIDAAGVEGAKIHDRETLLKSMAIARTDLLRALKIERVMRENADVASPDFQLFNVDLTQIAAMQIEDAASQHGRLMNEAFEIAQSVQVEVRKLQVQDKQMMG
jgi:hypothetical protein